jgi:hypothetical protein
MPNSLIYVLSIFHSDVTIDVFALFFVRIFKEFFSVYFFKTNIIFIKTKRWFSKNSINKKYQKFQNILTG